MVTVEDFRTVSKEEAEAIEPGCTSHTIQILRSVTGVAYLCHARLGIKWRAGA